MAVFDIEGIAERLVRIDDTFIPAVNVQIDGFPCVLDGHLYNKYFEVLFEYGNVHWEVSCITEDGDLVEIEVEVYANGGYRLDTFVFYTASQFIEFYKASCRHENASLKLANIVDDAIDERRMVTPW